MLSPYFSQWYKVLGPLDDLGTPDITECMVWPDVAVFHGCFQVVALSIMCDGVILLGKHLETLSWCLSDLNRMDA
jgi:hypothetical protein